MPRTRPMTNTFDLPEIDFNNADDIKSKIYEVAYILFHRIHARSSIIREYNDSDYIIHSQTCIMEYACHILNHLRATLYKHEYNEITPDWIELVTKLYKERKESFKKAMIIHLEQMELHDKGS